MTGLHCNILVQLSMPRHPFHLQTVQSVQREATRGDGFVLLPLVVAEFLHTVTDPKRFNPPRSMPEAVDWMDNFLTNPSVRLEQTPKEALRIGFEWMHRLKLGRKRILDTQLAASLHLAGVGRLITSNPDDFRVFGVFELIVP